MSLGFVDDNPAVYFGEKDVAIIITEEYTRKSFAGLKLSQLKYELNRIPNDDDVVENHPSIYLLFRNTESLDKIQRALDKVRDKLVSWELERKGISDDYCNGCDIKR